MVHRLLAVAIGADASYPDLLKKKSTQVKIVDAHGLDVISQKRWICW